MHLLLRVAVLALLGWQAVQWAIAEQGHLAATREIGWDLRLFASTDTRVQRVLGADAAIHASLRQLVPPGSTVMNRQVQGSLEELQRTAKSQEELVATFERLSARNGLFIQLTTLLYPDPFFLSVNDPIALVEAEVAAGRQPWLFVLEGDPEPTGRQGWQCVHREPRFQLWRLPKGS